MKQFWRVPEFASQVIFIFIGSVIFLALIGFAVEGFYPAGLQTKSVEQAHAFLFNNAEFSDLPNKVEITIDGFKSTFYKGTQSYINLSHLLHEGRSDQLFEQAGPRPQFPGVSHYTCGEMTISNYSLPSHFRIIRSEKNKNYYWIELPKLTSPGTGFPIFTVDPRVIAFLRVHDA